MTLSVKESLLVIAVVAILTFGSRVLPFLLFPENKKTPKWVLYLGKVLPLAIIGMLIVYCVKDISILSYPYGLPELIGIASVVLLHLWKKNSLLSICGGTVIYMVMVQVIFV